MRVYVRMGGRVRVRACVTLMRACLCTSDGACSSGPSLSDEYTVHPPDCVASPPISIALCQRLPVDAFLLRAWRGRILV